MRWLPLVLVASVAHAQPSERGRTEKKLAEALKDIKLCGKQLTATYDWAAFDAIDFAAAGKDKKESYGFERSNMEYLGIAINNMCKDADYKTMFGKIDTIVYRPTGDRTIKVEAVVDGPTLTFTNNIFGSTRDYHDYQDAIENAKFTGTAQPTKVAPPPSLSGAPSSAWDGTYPMKPLGGLGGLCPRSDLVGKLVVKGGRFSFPWVADDWRGGRGAPIETGQVTGIVHADGSTSTTVAFTNPGLLSNKPTIVKAKRLLDAVTTVPMTFARHGAGGRVVHGEVDVYRSEHTGTCALDWEIRDPAEVEAERREAARPRTKAEKETEAKYAKHSSCVDVCRTKGFDCTRDHCDGAKSSCWSRCKGESRCEQGCDADARQCRGVCERDEQSCRNACDR